MLCVVQQSWPDGSKFNMHNDYVDAKLMMNIIVNDKDNCIRVLIYAVGGIFNRVDFFFTEEAAELFFWGTDFFGWGSGSGSGLYSGGLIMMIMGPSSGASPGFGRGGGGKNFFPDFGICMPLRHAHC